MVTTDRYADETGRIVFGEWKTGEAMAKAKEAAKACSVDLTLLDQATDRLVTKLLYTFPDCTRKTLESLRKKKLEHWYQNSETSRSWLALNMTTEAAAGFRAFHYGSRDDREIDFALLRRRLAEGALFDEALIDQVLPASARARLKGEL
jgi:6-oxo-cyclohex-1-ene-carbonyl-CoA hydrolase